MVVALFEELVERGALYTAIGSRSEQELEELMTFLVWKIADHRFSNVLLDVTRITIEIEVLSVVVASLEVLYFP